ncbi:MAG: adenosine deaminase [Pseudomonadota bacterium]
MSSLDGATDLARFRALPKAEIHVHLEGTLDTAEIVAMAAAAHETLPRPPADFLRFKDLADFLTFLDWSCGLVRTPDQMTQVAYRFSQRLAASGTRYADAIINPMHWQAWRHRVAALIDALDTGFAAAEADGLPPVGLCVSVLRSQTADQAIELAELLTGLRHPRVVALSIDGNEAATGRTGPRFAEAFRRAGARGLRRTVHAGESSGPEGVRDALEHLGAERIDHGVRAIEDPPLVALLAERRIPLDICPTSNVSLSIFPSLADHPIDTLRRAGVRVSVNTDDPVLFGVSLAEEYAKCAAAFGWTDAIVRDIARTSIEASFANSDLKARLLSDLAAW